MGDVSDLIQEGALCQTCGVAMVPDDLPSGSDWIPPGFPQVCDDCLDEDDEP